MKSNMDFWQRKWFVNCGTNYLVPHLNQKIQICGPTKKHFYTFILSNIFPKITISINPSLI